MSDEQHQPSAFLIWLPLAIMVFALGSSGVLSAMVDDYNLIDAIPIWPVALVFACLAVPGLLWRRWLLTLPEQPNKTSANVFFIVFASLLIGIFGGRGGFVVLNAALNEDLSVIETRVVEREQARERRGKSTTTIHYVKIDVDLATGQPGDWYLELPRSEYARTVVGDGLDVRVGGGFFGMRYVDNIAVHRRPIDPDRLPSAAAAIGMERGDEP